MTEDDPVAALSALLDREAQALRAADFAALAALAAEKERLAQRIAAAGAALPGLAGLAGKAARNGAALQAAIGGVRAARLRLAELARATQGLACYGSDGRKTLHPAGSGKLEHRA